MTNKMKYIIVDNGMYESAILFDYMTQHDAMAAKVGGTVKSAGFVEIDDGEFRCFGKSLSLNIASRPTDSEYVSKIMGVTTDD